MKVTFNIYIETYIFILYFYVCIVERLDLGLGGPGHCPVFGTPFHPSLGLGLCPVSVHLDHSPIRS